MQGIQRARRARAGKGIQRSTQHRRGKLPQGDPSDERAGGLCVGAADPACVQPVPDFVPHQSAGHQSLVPEGGRRMAIFRQEMRKRDRRIEINHRSCRSWSSSPRISSRRATGGGAGGCRQAASVGGASHPARTASASSASARIGLLACLGGPISATTRSRLVTRTVSPEAARRTYSLNRLFSTLIPTDLMERKVAISRYPGQSRSGAGTACARKGISGPSGDAEARETRKGGSAARRNPVDHTWRSAQVPDSRGIVARSGPCV